jgi:hypothetical protein
MGKVADLAKVDLLDSTHALGKCGLFENVETTMQSFLAFYEDAEKTEAAARVEGYDGINGSLMDYVEPSDYRTGKTFPSLAAAEQWLKTEIDAMKTVFGCGTIRKRERVSRRCRYCVCGGVRDLHEYTVEDTGIVEDEAMEDECLS